MQKKFFGIAWPTFIVAAAFMFGVSIARLQPANAALGTVAAVKPPVAAAAGGVSCMYCRQMYLMTGDYYSYMICLYQPPCSN